MRTAYFSNDVPFSRRTRLLSAASVLAVATGFCFNSARAQEASETVTVTSTRIQREGYNAPTPVTSISSKDLELEAPSNLGEVLNNIPSFKPAASPTTSGVNSLGGGVISADLRGLGSPRTLVLVNGKRFIPSDASGAVDLTQVPTLLVKRVEVVTGGASAAYGSDAVAGVVNFILDDHIDGIRGSLQYGTSEYGDDIEEQGAVAYGGRFFADQLTFTIGVNYINNEGILGQYTRPWGREEVGLITNPAFATNGLPNFIISPGVHTATQSAGGLINSGPLKGTAFATGGAPRAFTYGTIFGSSMIGGEQETPNPTLNSYLGKPFNSISSLAHVQYQLTPDIDAYVDISAAHTGAGGASQQPRDAALVINSDNAYLNTAVKASMAANKITTFTLGRYYDDTGAIKLRNSDGAGRVIAGLEGTVFDDWTWDANYQFGQNHYKLVFGPNNRNQANFLRAADAVLNSATNTIVCRSTLTAPTNGCIPVNVFGNGSAVINSYAYGSATYDLLNEQNVADIDLRGDPFSTWAGKVSVATGAEWRRESARAVADGISTQINADNSTGGWALGNQKNFAGAYNIYEGYLETVVPVLADMPLGKEADINAALRLTSYSTAGGVTTWKVGFNYQPIDDLRIRGTRSHDVRAPNLSELYQGGTGSSYTAVFDKVLNQTVQVRQVGSGNTALKPEAAETYTAGFVFQPSWFSGFGLSVDYYNIRIAKVISTIGAATLAAGCYAGNTLYCQSVVFNANGTLNYINSGSLNLNSLKTAGFDFEASYNIAAEDIIAEAPGTFTTHLLATFVDQQQTILPGNVLQNTLGQLSNFNRVSGVPQWVGNADIGYNFDPFALDVRVRYVGAGRFNNGLRTGVGFANSISKNEVSDAFYVNLTGSYTMPVMDHPTQFYVTINNLFDKDPLFLPSQAAGGTAESSTNTTYYDSIGRLFRVGIRISE